MAYSITQFENSTSASAAALDNNFTTFGALVPIPCGIAGTNTLVLTQNTAGQVPAPTIQGYSTNMLFTGIAASTNTGPTTATVGSAGVLNVYKDGLAGPVLLAGNEIVGGNAISLRYDASLNSGAGGFHLVSSTSSTGGAVVVGNATLTNLFSGNSPTLTFTATPGWSSQDVTFSITAALANALPAIGDFVQVNPPSLGAIGVDFRGLVLGVGSISSIASAATINIRLLNAASASLASNSGVYRYLATRTVP
jgi:hypothetical protein